MNNFEDDQLDLLDDGDGTNEMCILFDKDNGQKQQSTPPKRGCGVVLLIISSPLLVVGASWKVLF